MSSKAIMDKGSRPHTLILYGLLFTLITAGVLLYYSDASKPEQLFFAKGRINECCEADNILMYLAYATAFLLALDYAFPKRKLLKKVFYASLILIVVASAFTYFYVEKAACSRTYVQIWDTYHYFIGAKYFNELGYTRLYECTLAADEELGGRIDGLKYVRDLSTYRLVDYRRILSEAECNAYFTKERWREFKTELTFFLERRKSMWPEVLKDHGYHGTPAYNFLAQTILGSFRLTYRNLLLVSLIDVASIFIMFAYVAKTFGPKTGFLFSALFCVNYPGRFLPIGGSVIRYVWMTLLVVGLCLIREKRYGQAGVLMASSSMLQVFPALFSLGMGVKAFTEYARKRKLSADYKRFFACFTATVLILFILGASVGEGLENWVEFKKQMDLNAYRFSQHRIGFKYAFMPQEIAGEKEFAKVKTVYYAAVIILLTVAAALTPKLDDMEASILLGFTLLLTLTVTVTYYYIVASVLLLLWHEKIDDGRGRIAVIALFTVMGLLYTASKIVFEEGIFPENDSARNQAFIYNTLASMLFTAYLLVAVACLAHEKQTARWAAPPSQF